MPYLRTKSATFTPAAASFRMPMICSSLYRVLRICPPGSVVPEDSHASWTCSRGLGQGSLAAHQWVRECLNISASEPLTVCMPNELGASGWRNPEPVHPRMPSRSRMVDPSQCAAILSLLRFHATKLAEYTPVANRQVG